ncbi:MAG: hypothetical protein Q9212_001970 [Teloschistes hypoglaucus]
MIQKHHNTAKANGAIIIPEIGLESSPSDLLAWLLATTIRDRLSVGTKEVVASVHEIKSQPSGGTLATATSILGHYSLSEFAKSSAPWALSPIPGPRSSPVVPLVTRLLGVRKVQHLGTLTTSMGAGPNVATVQRTWGLLGGPKGYGSNFQYHEYMRVKNSLAGAIIHGAIGFFFMAIIIPPVRWLIQMAAHNFYAPGQGASREETANESFELRAIAEADQDIPEPRKAMARFRHDGGIYHLTGIFLAEAAMLTAPQRIAYKVTFLEMQAKQGQIARDLSNIYAMEFKMPGFAQSFFRNSILPNFLCQMGNLVSAPRSRPQLVHHGFHDTGDGSLGKLWALVETLKAEAEANTQLARQKHERRRHRNGEYARQPSHRAILEDSHLDAKIRITQLQRGSVKLALRSEDMGIEVFPLKVHRFKKEQTTRANHTSVEVRMHHNLGK